MFELRDRGTLMPVLAIRPWGAAVPTERERALWARAGYGDSHQSLSSYVILIPIEDLERGAQCDPYGWRGARTLPTAHLHIANNWSDLVDGAVIDVQYLLGETDAPKVTELRSWPG